ncbi:MAG TPA: M64 family metallopeptidase [Planctomycetota bacterium]|nr:M64 family metallopeptidase [Planctomycetota bacterium]
MPKELLIALALTACAAPSSEQPDFEKTFTNRTLRIEYAHSNGGAAMAEQIADCQLRAEPEWPGPRTRRIDDSGFGKYKVELRDAKSQVLYSRGFCSIYGEWETTPEAKTLVKSFEESVRVPEPRESFRFALQKRQDDGSFRDLFVETFDVEKHPPPAPSASAAGSELITLFENGDLAHHVDLLIASDGYAKEQRDKFVADAKRLVDVMFQTQPYRRLKSTFNVRALFVPTPTGTSGIGNPRAGILRETAFGMSYNAFGSDRYVLAMNDRKLREICAPAPYDALILLFNERKYGGGGIYNLWATVAADTEPAPYIFVHEFGHSFAGLGDEYYTSQVAYEDFVKPGVEPWEPNVTALLDPASLKWKALVSAGTPLPTPWDQAHFDEIDLAYQRKRAQMIADRATEAAMEALFREVKGTTGPLLAAEKYANKVGAFEGASYEAKGLYRPEIDCIMFTRNPTHFCKVCERAIEQAIGRSID